MESKNLSSEETERLLFLVKELRSFSVWIIDETAALKIRPFWIIKD